jgi:hypothetical protein
MTIIETIIAKEDFILIHFETHKHFHSKINPLWENHPNMISFQ